MKHPILFGAAMGLSTLGMLFFIAGSSGMHIMPRNYANFSGIASFMFSVVAWAIWAGQEKRQ